jgi:hypothetical protein
MNFYKNSFTKRLIWLIIFSAAMAYLESAVVVYLRALYYPNGFEFPLKVIPSEMLGIEIGREAATLLMLIAIGFLFSNTAPGRFATICVAFGVWDIFYYFWLVVFIKWPESLLTWDLLFLIPAPWIGPVIAPILVSICLIIAGIIILQKESRGLRFHPPWWSWAVEIIAGLLIICTFLWNLPAVIDESMPTVFPWWIFLLGLIGGMILFVMMLYQPGYFQELHIRGDKYENPI